MSASESSPIVANLHESIEHLIAETVRQSHVSHEEEKQALRDALQSVLGDIEASQLAMQRAADRLRAVIDAPAPETSAPVPTSEPVADEPATTPEDTETATEQPAQTPVVAGPHELDVIAHDVSISIASGLQSLLRARPEVTSAQTREFVNGELRLKLDMASGLDMAELEQWIGTHNGRITAQTDSVLELRFGD